MSKTKIKNITVNLKLLNQTKNIYATLIYAYLREAYQDGRHIMPEGYFMCSSEEIADNLCGFTRYQQTTGLKELQELGLIDTKLMGFPAFRFIKLMPYSNSVSNYEKPKFELEDNVPELPPSFQEGIAVSDYDVPDLDEILK